MKRIIIFCIALAVMLSFCGCNFTGSAAKSDTSSGEQSKTESTELNYTVNTSDMFTDRDMEIGYDEETSAVITLSKSSAYSSSDAVNISGSTITVTTE